MRQLAVVQFFTWFALFCMWIYFVPAVATKVFGAQPGTPAYQRGNEWGGVCFSIYNGTAFGFAFILLALVRRFSARSIHRVCLICGGAGLLLAVAIQQQYPLILSMLLVGIAWTSILSMPYAMLSNAIPASKMGFYMGVFNFFIVIPQILASLGLGLLMRRVLGGNPMNAVLVGGLSMVFAGLCVGFVSKNVDAAADVDSLTVPELNPAPVLSPPPRTKPAGHEMSAFDYSGRGLPRVSGAKGRIASPTR
jgi:maltose/moltooligosaccharide transporter